MTPIFLARVIPYKRYRLRFVGGPMSGITSCCDYLASHTRSHTSPPTDYFLVRLRGRRCVMVEEKLCREITAWHEVNRQMSIRIIADHADYVVCSVCNSLSPRILTGSICPRCHSYRFLSGVEEVSAAADRLVEQESPWLRHFFSL